MEIVLIDDSPATVAIVIKADRESVRVLDQDGSVSTRLPSQITKIETRKTAVATDKNGSEIRVGDVVRELGGEGKTGTILHLHRSYVFVHNRTQLENSGLWTTRSTNVVTTAAKGARNPGTDLSKMNPALQMRNGTNGAMPPPKSMGRDPLLGKQVKVRKGGYKGNNGLVKDTTDTTARVELQATNKIVTVEKEHLMVIEYVYNCIELDMVALIHRTVPTPAKDWNIINSVVLVEHLESCEQDWEAHLPAFQTPVVLPWASPMVAVLLHGVHLRGHQHGEVHQMPEIPAGPRPGKVLAAVKPATAGLVT